QLDQNSPTPMRIPYQSSFLPFGWQAWICLRVSLAVLGLTTLALSAGCSRPAPPAQSSAPDKDPRLTFVTPYANVRPDVQYVGDKACAACHVDHADAYGVHPMSRSLVAVSQVLPRERYDA